MLRELHISNLAVIEDARLELGEGLNCFTGQTGAGKSLILGAFGLLLGFKQNRQIAELIRPGADEGRVTGVFQINDPTITRQVARLADQPIHPDDELLLTRKLFASGRSSVSINGHPATAAMVKAIGELLVDVHGQNDQQYLLKPSNQVIILDAFGQCESLRDQYTQVFNRHRDETRRLEQLSTSALLRRQQLDLYEFQLSEIDAACPQPGEFHELKARLRMLGNMQKLKAEVGSAYATLYDAEGSIIERLQVLVHLLHDLHELDPSLADQAEQTRTSTLALQDVAFELNRYVDSLDHHPQELAEVEDRLDTLNRLLSKYEPWPTDGAQRTREYDASDEEPIEVDAIEQGTDSEVDDSEVQDPEVEDPIDGLLHYRDQIAAEIDRLRGENEDSDNLDETIRQLAESMADLGGKLTNARLTAAKKLCPKVEKQLKSLGMTEAKLTVDVVAADEPTATGLDRVEFMIRTNPGQPARPLRKIASGGEMSRMMLALKGILAGNDRISVLVFDEIDANIGGRMGTVIGKKLRNLASGGHQVVCITHLPQIAAFADRHLHIRKDVTGSGKKKQTRTLVSLLEGPVRVDELAEMLAGKNVTPTTRKQVEEMLADAK